MDGPNGAISEPIYGKAVMTRPSTPNQLSVSFNFPDSPFLTWFLQILLWITGPNYWVMDTDYENYSLVVGCEK